MATLAEAKPDQMLTLGGLIEHVKNKLYDENGTDPLVAFDLGCGRTPEEGFQGVDFHCESAINADLFAPSWDFTPDDSVDFFYSSHFVEHVPHWNTFFEAAHAKLKKGGYFLITTPYGSSNRAHQDPDHKQIIFEERYLYLSKDWRDKNNLGHYSAQCDFDYVNRWPIWHPDFQGLSEQAQMYAMKHYRNSVLDLTVLLRAKK